MTPTAVYRMNARPCEQVEAYAARLVVAAWMTNAAVFGFFNEFPFYAKPGSTRQDVLRAWDAKQRASYFGGDR